jgi:alkylhydroperoxidase family enzyme
MSRIAPLARPWPEEFEQAMARTMPPGMEPLTLFRAIATSPRAWQKFSAGSLLDKGPLPLREREIVIDRTTARCGCGYEWGIHVALFGPRAGLGPELVAATVADEVDAQLWSEAECVLIETVDSLLDRKRLSDDEFERLRTHFEDEQILEIVQLISFYHGVSLICGALDLAPEPGMPNLPATGA